MKEVSGMILGNVRVYRAKATGESFAGFPDIEVPSRLYGAVSMQDHASTSENEIECFIALPDLPTGIRVLHGGKLTWTHEGAMSRYAGADKPINERFRPQDNYVRVELVDLGGEFDVADRSEAKHGLMIGGTMADNGQDLAWPSGAFGKRIEAPLMAFEVPHGANMALRLSSALKLHNDDEWRGRESWLARIGAANITLTYESEALPAPAQAPTEEQAFIASLLADPAVLEFFMWLAANPDQLEMLKMLRPPQ